MSSPGGISNLTGGVPCTVSTATTSATTTANTSASTASGVPAATSDFNWFQHLLNMGPLVTAQVPPSPGGPSVDIAGFNPMLLQLMQMQQSMQQMFMLQQQFMAHGSSVNTAVSIWNLLFTPIFV